MKKFILLFLFGSLSYFGISQNTIELNHFPKDRQLLPRNTVTNKGYYTISGQIPQNIGYSALDLKIFRGDILLKETPYTLNFNQNLATFSMPFDIAAELINYRIELYGLKNNTLILIQKAENVVAGDVILINGQSNNIGSHADIDDDIFMRSYTDKYGWNYIRYSQPGKWSPRIAKNIIANHKIPVAIFNESFGGVRMDYFMKNDSDPYSGNYGEMMKRLEIAEVKAHVKAIVWWQGESDGWETSIEDYKKMYKKLHADWAKDYNKPHCYLFQIRFRSCTHKKPYVLEAQRQLSNEIAGLGITSTSAAKIDSCHFYYTGGYDTLGNRMYRVMAADMYGASPTNAKAPDVYKAWFSAPNEITILMKNVVGNLKAIGSPWADFRLEGRDSVFTEGGGMENLEGSVSGNKIILRFKQDSSKVKGVSYLSHITNDNDWIVNFLGSSILSFYNVPIESKLPVSNATTEGVSEFDINPTLSREMIVLNWDIDSLSKKTVTIYDILGKPVYFKNIENDAKNLEIDTRNFVTGYYFVIFKEIGKKQVVKKIVKV